MKMNEWYHLAGPYAVTRMFEQALCDYTGAKYAVAVNSCTAAILLACQWHKPAATVSVPKRTYASVPMAVLQAGHYVAFPDINWLGAYQLEPLPVWDSARRFTSGMYDVPGRFLCVSFSASKILAAEQGGAILHDNPQADAWFRRMRFDGRTEGADPMADNLLEIGWHCIMLPSVAAGLLLKLYHLPKHNEDLPEREYPDLSKWEAFKNV